MQDQQLKLIIEAQNRASKEIQALRKEMGGLDSDTKKLGSTSEKSGNKILSGLGGALKSIGKLGAAATGAAATGVGFLAKSAVESFAEYEQLVGGTHIKQPECPLMSIWTQLLASQLHYFRD